MNNVQIIKSDWRTRIEDEEFDGGNGANRKARDVVLLGLARIGRLRKDIFDTYCNNIIQLSNPHRAAAP